MLALQSRRRTGWLAGLALGSALGAAHCAPSQRAGPPAAVVPAVSSPAPAASAPAASGPAASGPAQAAEPDDARGGRLYDNWRTERRLSQSFAADSPKTPEPDGKGGPNGNGTLNDGAGRPLQNTGHDYRLKNLFGWDLRGADGVDGPAYHDEPHVLRRNLLTDTRSASEIQRWLAEGDARTPAYGQVLDERDLSDLTAFLVKTRDGELARPEHIFRLEAAAPEGYELVAGADPARGRELYGYTCEDCHGKDGRELTLDGMQSVGTLSRSVAYEVWFKIQNGLAGSPMKRQVLEKTGAESARAVLDLLAALCDRKAFPALRGRDAEDVKDGDARCGAYLK